MKTFKKIALVCFFFFFAPFLCAAEGIQWETDFKTAMKLAEDSGRLVIIHFYGDACPPCRKMDKEVFALKDVADALAPYFIPLKVNSETNPKAVQNLKIDSIPMDLIVTPDREIIYRRKGFCNAYQFVNEVVSVAVQRQHDILREQKEQELLAQKATEIPVVSQTALLDPNPAAMQGQNVFPPPNAPRTVAQAAQQAAPAFAQMPPGTPLNAQTANVPDPLDVPLPDLAIAASTQMDPETTAPPMSDLGIEVAPDVATDSVAVAQTVNAPIGNPVDFDNTPNNTLQNHVEPNQVAMNHVAPNQAVPSNTVASNAAPSNAPLFPDDKNFAQESIYVLDGFCPVELQDHERWTPGSSDYAIRYKNQYFLFSGEEAMRSFAKNPKIYMPVAMGDDVVQLLQNGQRIKGKRHFGAWYQGRIYLFATQKNYDVFAERPAYFADFATRLDTTVSSSNIANNRR